MAKIIYSIGEELNQLARLLFDESANKWYLAIIFEIAAGIIAAVFTIITSPDPIVMGGAILGTIFLIASYALRMFSEQRYSTAETMRRQSVLSEALGWRVSKTQMSRWRQEAGKHILDKLKTSPRDTNYYSTQKDVGFEKLAEMTLESAFYTRHIYNKIRYLAWVIFLVATTTSFVVISAAISGIIPNKIELIIAKVLFAIIPTVLAIDVLGWAIKLGLLINEICNIEGSIEKMLDGTEKEVPQLLRMVSEYNCLVITGLPIHNWLFKQWHGEIDELWKKRWN